MLVLLTIVAIVGAWVGMVAYDRLRDWIDRRRARGDLARQGLEALLGERDWLRHQSEQLTDELAETQRSLAEERRKAVEREAERHQVTLDTRRQLMTGRCTHCGGTHAISCPRVKRMRFRGDGQSPLEVEFFDHWDQSRVVFPEDLDVVEQTGS